MSRPVRVAFLFATFGVGGVERLVQAIMGGLDRSRVEAIAITLKEPGPIGDQLAAAGHRVLSRLARGNWDVRGIGRLARVLAAERVDVVHVTDSALPLLWAGWLRRRRDRPRLILGFHSSAKPGDHLKYAIANACALAVVDRFVALAESHRDFLCGHYHLSPERFTVIGNGVDSDRFRPTSDRAGTRRALGLEPEHTYVGIVAGLVYQKDHPLFLRAAKRIGARFPEARFLIIGDGPERSKLEALTQRLGLQGVVQFLGAREDTPALYQALDVAVLCTLPDLEAFPVTLLEAMASRVPVVSTSVGSIPDFVRDGETGCLVASGDEAGLARAIQSLLSDPFQAARMGRAGRENVERTHPVAGMIRAYERLFTQVGA